MCGMVGIEKVAGYVWYGGNREGGRVCVVWWE